MTVTTFYRFSITWAVVLAVSSGLAWAQDAVSPDQPEVNPVDATHYQQVVSKAIKYLENNQAANGSFSEQLGPAVTAMCTTALLENGVPRTSPVVQKGLDYLQGFVHSDGGVYAPDSNLRNYETSVAVMCFAAANQDGRYDDIIRNAVNFQKNIQCF